MELRSRALDEGEIWVGHLGKAVRLIDIVGKYETEGFDSVLEHDEVVSGEH